MTEEQPIGKLDESVTNGLRGSLNRRTFVQRSLVLGASIPAMAALLAACGGDGDDPTATTAAGATATEGGGETEATPTEAMAEPTATGEMAEATPTEAMEEPTATEEMAEPTATSGETGGEERPGYFGFTPEPAENQGGIVVLTGEPSDMESVHPLFIDGYPTSLPLFEYLATVGPDGLETEGILAEAWEVSDDGLVWTFMLREGVLFHDGEVLDANDVKVTWDLHADPAAGSYYGEYNAEVIESVEVVDDLTVAFNLLEPYQLFIQDYINYFFVGAEHILSQVSPEEQQSSPIATGEDASMVVGTGPFRFVAWVPGEALEFERFDDYWGGQPYLDGIAFKFSDSQAALSAALQTGEVDFYPDVDAGIVPELEGAPVTISTAPGTSMRTILFNLDPEMSPFFQDVRVRQALMYALDTVAMTEASEFGYPTQPVGFLPEQNVLADPEALEMTYGYDPDQAMALLDEAGWVPGADGVRENGGQRLSFRLVHTDGDPARDIRALTAQEFWRQVGVETEIIIEPFQVHQERVRDNHDFDVSLENISANAYGDLSFYFQCDAYPDLGNWGRYCNEELDTLMDELNAAEDLEAKQEFVNQIQNVLLADLPRLPLNVSTEIGAINDRLHNVFFYAGHPYIAMHNWWVEA